MEQAEINEIKARCEKATPGLWKVNHNNPWVVGAKHIVYKFLRICEVDNSNDADFIAHSREDIPRLLAEVERLNCLIQGGREEHADECKWLRSVYIAEAKRLKTENAKLQEKQMTKPVEDGLHHICPNCGTNLDKQLGFVEFCGKCGQALKWEE